MLQDAEDLQVVTVTAAIQADRGLASSEGALVVEISDNLSRITGLATGDALLGVNNRRVDTAREAAEELRRTQQGDRSFFLAFERDGRRGAYGTADLEVDAFGRERSRPDTHPSLGAVRLPRDGRIFAPAFFGTWRRLWLALAEA